MPEVIFQLRRFGRKGTNCKLIKVFKAIFRLEEIRAEVGKGGSQSLTISVCLRFREYVSS